MCRFCMIVWQLLGPGYQCRPCFRHADRFRRWAEEANRAKAKEASKQDK